MKIINIENGKKKAYVQLNDLAMLMHWDGIIPCEVVQKTFMHPTFVEDENRFEFAQFEDPSTIEFFEQCDWIVDFKDFKNLTQEEFFAIGEEMVNKKNEIAKKWNNMSLKEQKKNNEIYFEYEKLDFKIKSTAEILWTKQGHRVMPFPVVPADDGFVVNNEDSPYIAKQGINPLQVLIYKRNGEIFNSKEDIIPEGLIQASETLLISENLEHNQFFVDAEKTRKLSDDKKYLVTTFRIITPEKTKSEDNIKIIKDQEVRSLGKTIKELLSRTFKRKF